MAEAEDPADVVNSMIVDSAHDSDFVPVAFPGRDGRARLPWSCKAECMKASLTH